MAMSGVMAISEMTPKASPADPACRALETPRVKDRIKEEAMGPEATPPESKAMAVNMGGQNRVKLKVIRYPMTRMYNSSRLNR